MNVVGEFTIPAEAFALERALSAVPEMSIEADRLASHSPREVFPFFWATGGAFDRFTDALKADPSITAADAVERTDDDALYRVEWNDDFCELVHDMIDHHAAILEASASADRWNLRLRFADEEMMSSFQRHFEENGRSFTVHNLTHPAEPRQREFGLTAEQHEALVIAVQEGYFSIPRTASVEEIGQTLGISANAVSQRLRRGNEALIQSALTIPEADEE